MNIDSQAAAQAPESYGRYYASRSTDRDDLLFNREVLFQAFAFEKANTRALQAISVDRESSRVLDVGCGSGAGLLGFVRWGFPARNLTGIDLDGSRIERARELLPAASLVVGSADEMQFDSGSFDLVFESTIFLQMTDEDMAGRIAKEMLRVVRPGGHIVICDWRYGKPGNPDFRAVNRTRIASLFGVGSATDLVRVERGALIPPIGRFLSRSMPALYFAAQTVAPFLAGQTTTVLRSRKSVG